MSHPALLRAVAAHGLAASTLGLPDGPLDDDAWADLLRGVRSQRLAGLLAEAVASGALEVTDSQLAEVIELHRAAIGSVLLLERQLQHSSAALDAAGIAHRAVKGAAFAHLDYPNPSWRHYGDVDVLLPTAELDRAVEVLLDAGHERRNPPLRPGFEARFAKSVELRVGANGAEVDLHRLLVPEPLGWWIVEADLFADPATFTLAGQAVPAPSRSVRFLHACYHAALGFRPTRLVPLRDLVEAAGDPAFDWREAVTLAERWRGAPIVAHAVRTAMEAFALEPASGLWWWARGHRSDEPATRILEHYLHGTRRQTERSLDALRALPRWRDRAAYLSALLRPDRAYLEYRGVSAGDWWRQGARSLERRLRR